MTVSNLKKIVNGEILLDDISFTLNQNDKIGLVGINGSGKSTLLKILSNNLDADSGNINLGDETIGYLKQEIPNIYNNKTILEFIKIETNVEELETKLHELETNLNEQNMDEYSEVLNQFLSIDGYSFEDNLNIITNGLRLNKDLNSQIETLSGGEKIKVLLASLLLKNNDILLLDEPTNNLDIEAINWLENYLNNQDKKMIIVSHDETFLNNITNKIYELSNGKISIYNLSYNDYLVQKENEYNREYEEYIRAKEKKDKLKKQYQKAKEWSNKGTTKKAHNDNDKIANNFAKERTNSSNVSKIAKELENLEIPNFEEKKDIDIFFELDTEKGNKDIVLDHLVCGYDNFETPAFNLQIPYGTKLEITGENGSGKTTLIKTILGETNPKSGNVLIGSGAKIGYISQDTLANDIDETIEEYLTKENNDIEKSKMFSVLDKFNIDYDDRNKLYKNLSPGQRTRVNIAKLALDKINILIIDEITNHLDKEALDLIYELVSNFKGTIISISHNRKYNEILNSDIVLNCKTGDFIYQMDTNSRKR